MDVVYPLSNGSTWENNELRFSLRSLELHYPRVKNLYIVGTKPDWIKNVTFIPYRDVPGLENKERNIMNKIVAAINCKTLLSKDFIFMNDDHFILDSLPFPYYFQESLNASVLKRGVDSYSASLNNTLKALESKKLQTLNFDIHCPIVYNKEKFIRVMDQYDWTVYSGYVIKSLYCNTLGIKGTEMPDLKIKSRMDCFKLEALTTGRKFFSIYDEAIGPDLTTYLYYLYPNKSKWEL